MKCSKKYLNKLKTLNDEHENMYSPLGTKDIESELSYAYLHAVASKIGVGCHISTRHEDNRGIDTQLTCWQKFDGCYREEIDLKIQLKATIKQPADSSSHFSYFFDGVKQYDFLREKTQNQHRILIVLFLPSDSIQWLNVTSEELILKKCAYWVSLKGAPESQNSTGQTIYLPKEQILTPDNLLGIFEKIALNKSLDYVTP
jgi:hypothetical protein